MKRLIPILIALALAVYAVPLFQANAQTGPSGCGVTQFRVLGFSALPVTSSAAVSLTPPANTQIAVLTAQANAANWREDGTAPKTAATGVGVPLASGATIYLCSLDSINKFQIIAQSTGLTAEVTFYGR